MSSRFMSVNHFPYLPIVTNPEKNPCIQTVIQTATEIYSFIPENFMQIRLEVFCEKFKFLTDKQTNNDENVSSLAEVMR